MSTKSSSSDLAWVPAPRDIPAGDRGAAIRAAARNAVNDTEFAEFMGYLFGEVDAA